MKKHYYSGNLNIDRPDLPKAVKQAYFSYRNQKSRCYNQKDINYQNYGARGIEVKYSVREFVGWWLDTIAGKNLKKPSINRIDVNGNYCFENIEIIELSDNVKEMIARRGNVAFRRKKPFLRPVVCVNGEKTIAFCSYAAAAKFFDVSPRTITFRVHYTKIKKRKVPRKFEYNVYTLEDFLGGKL